MMAMVEVEEKELLKLRGENNAFKEAFLELAKMSNNGSAFCDKCGYSSEYHTKELIRVLRSIAEQ